jgi:hypothetical protein
MTPETTALLYQCRTAMLQRDDQALDTLLKSWLEYFIGDEDMDEMLDDLCLLLGYKVQSEGAAIAYATYTAWWEVEGYLEPGMGTFICSDVVALRQRLLGMPIKQFDLVVELAYQALSFDAELRGNAHLPTGQTWLRAFALWLKDTTVGFEKIPCESLMYPRNGNESKTQRRAREQKLVEQSRQQRYIVVYPDIRNGAKDLFRHWCKVDGFPYLCVEMTGVQLARITFDVKTLNSQGEVTLSQPIRDQLMALVEPYIARSRVQHYRPLLQWVSQRCMVIEEVLAEDAEQIAQELVTLWSSLPAEEKQQSIKQDTRHYTPIVPAKPAWTLALERMHTQKKEQQPPLPALPATVVLPPDWESLLTKEQLYAFLEYLELPTRTRDLKTDLAARLLEKIETDQVARAEFFEVFAHELAVPPYELQVLLYCTASERKRWIEEGKLPVLSYRSFHKAGSDRDYPVIDRRVVLSITPEELAQWRAEHQEQVRTNRQASAQAAAASRKTKRS